ncbi:CDP-diacylglycerol--inositol 3-phosphatidyltransferase [Trichoplax sp. H2]|uniref:CDP-diacylglycerol--inositol 3-phosphatidyltransferase n=1 Tax=Trichoplax adhaerens TaxID=10228 RepID=B3S565_TRIAD|nr:hypothetical protein TRIADDRAFT_28979 [Trichoplax adhaerens]EDV22081.1 hypothetical protein TRIADDRAFT_28979 [Trichoplax adhaerens]RDD46499.1 CDP-diacylglycerol--inositol 3-phosphatidyltransferase [Trichoplax sp. H2]|eukprot:XP_002115236.1 hypothetical protein TRIADDRAFT_28979 [Trichoplax adhaerens]
MGENIFLFLPNLIGYARVILACAAFYYMPTNHLLCGGLYILSQLLDAFDGYAARYLNQCTKFGAVLDMLTDRCCTVCLMVVLAKFYEDYYLMFQFLIALDITSHWFHMYSSFLKGSSSHKHIDLSGNPLLRLYYTSRPVLFFMCAGNEFFFAMLYLLHFEEGPAVNYGSTSIGLWKLIAWISLPVCILKQLISIVHLITASQNIANADLAERETPKKQ